MVAVASPRKDFRGLTPIPSEWHDPEDWLRIMSVGVRQLQERSLKYPVEVVSTTANYTMVDTDRLIKVNATDGDRTVTLLTAAAREGRAIYVKKMDATANLVTIDAAGSETLDDATTVSLTQKNAVRGYMSDGVNWMLISSIGTATEL